MVWRSAPAGLQKPSIITVVAIKIGITNFNEKTMRKQNQRGNPNGVYQGAGTLNIFLITHFIDVTLHPSVLFLKFHPGRRKQIEMTFLREGEYEILIIDQMDL